MKKYYLDEKNHFIIEDYDKTKTFASFLPSVAGVDGIPLWVYYVNRGQVISSFGVNNKDNPILDFVPANMGYRLVELTGFRTFIKIEGNVHELFSSASLDKVSRKMIIGTNTVSIEEINYTLNLKVKVTYFIISREDYPGLVRKVQIRNLSDKIIKFELIDGLPTLWPAGVNNTTIKNMSNLSVAWNDVINGENNLPFYRIRSTTEDITKVEEVKVGHFYATINENGKLLPIIYDVDLVFSTNTALLKAENFEVNSLKDILKQTQISANKLPSAFTALDGEVSDSITFYTVIGRMPSIDTLKEKAKEFNIEYFTRQEQYALQIGENLVKAVKGKTAYPVFDAYVKQCYVDNLLRGGFPLIFKGKEGNLVYHVFSRIHGDMEREYNYFVVEPTFYSQGNGNFRDVNQNRRNDVYFVKEAGEFNIKQFMELIQLDGYNPLTIKGSSFIFDNDKLDEVLKHVQTKQEKISEVLAKKFTPGSLLKCIVEGKVKLSINNKKFLSLILENSTQEIESSFGAGYWIDHWTYNMDLIENFLNVFPDKLETLLFTKKYRYYESPVTVLPRKQKYVLTEEGKVRQLNAIIFDKEKVNRLKLDVEGTNWVKDKKGKVYFSTLYVKLLSLLLNKFTSLDQFGMGIMMDAEKPGWNDAMNGLPAIFGSGMSETIELVRVVNFLMNVSRIERKELIPQEMFKFLKGISEVLNKDLDNLEYFNKIQDIREGYREEIRFGISGKEVTINISELQDFYKKVINKLTSGIKKAKELGKGIIPTYLSYQAEDYVVLNHKHPINGLPNVEVKKWRVRMLPHFLEAPARLFKLLKSKDKAKELYDLIINSKLYDDKLKMYITSVPLDDETIEIGRIRAFTPGWLERESCFMHMEYKYLLGMLKSGLYEEFFQAIKTCLPPFMNPEVYGRSILENSSFIASSRNPNPNNHGRGFVARLTGTTSEMLSMYLLMMQGEKIFSVDNDELVFNLNPILPGAFFDENSEVRFTLLNQTEVIYINKTYKNTYGENKVSVKKYTLITNDSKTVIEGDKISGNLAQQIRDGIFKQIVVELN